MERYAGCLVFREMSRLNPNVAENLSSKCFRLGQQGAFGRFRVSGSHLENVFDSRYQKLPLISDGLTLCQAQQRKNVAPL
jgi:hypothetical protein